MGNSLKKDLGGQQRDLMAERGTSHSEEVAPRKRDRIWGTKIGDEYEPGSSSLCMKFSQWIPWLLVNFKSYKYKNSATSLRSQR